jgi:hypothetical protein
MRIEAVVHSVSRQPVAVNTQVEGEPVRATVDGLSVELVTSADRHGSLTLNFFGRDRAAAEQLFKQDARVTILFEPAKEEPAADVR